MVSSKEREDELNEDWEKRQDIVSRKDKHMCCLDGMYTAPLLIKMFLIHWKCTVVKTVWKLYRAHWRCCFKELSFENRKVSDHCHYTGLYWRATHNNFITKYQIPDHITIVFHNRIGYDVHIFIKKLGKSLARMILKLLQKTRKSTLLLMSKSTLKELRNSNRKLILRPPQK